MVGEQSRQIGMDKTQLEEPDAAAGCCLLTCGRTLTPAGRPSGRGTPPCSWSLRAAQGWNHPDGAHCTGRSPEDLAPSPVTRQRGLEKWPHLETSLPTWAISPLTQLLTRRGQSRGFCLQCSPTLDVSWVSPCRTTSHLVWGPKDYQPHPA